MPGRKNYINKVVNEFMEPNTSHAKLRYIDLLRVSLWLYNEIVAKLRGGSLSGLDIVDFVLSKSDFIEETTLMRQQMEGDIRAYKRDLVFFYNEGQGYRDGYKIPYSVKTIKAFNNKKANKVKDYAIELVTKMYRLDQINRREIAEEINAVST
jgi:hypothetical protein